VLEKTALRLTDRTVELHLPPGQDALLAEPVWRRLERLAFSLARVPDVVTG
jgi:hypothetical protein